MKKFILLFLAVVVTTFHVFAQNSVIDLFSIRKPKSESCQQQQDVLKKWRISTDNIFQFKAAYIDSMYASLAYTLDTQMYKYHDFSPIQFRVYDKNGSFVTGWEYCFGSINKIGILSKNQIKDLKRLLLNRSVTLANDLHLIDNLSCQNDLNLIKVEDYDYVIIAFWANYYGRGAKKMLQAIEKFKTESDEMNILFIKVNYNGSDNW